MLPLPKIIWYEAMAPRRPQRQPEPAEAMDDIDQVRSYVKAYEWGGPTSALQLHHLRELSRLIRPGDRVLDLACGPGPLLLELAPLLPESSFTGADLSPTMLAYLSREVEQRGLANVTVLREDIRTLPSIAPGSVDVVISTSALHHLSDDASLEAVFRRISSVLKPGGAVYLFDFALLRSAKTRALFVAEVARLAPPVTARDYAQSLPAAFPIDVVRTAAQRQLPRSLILTTSAFVDFFFCLQTPPRVDRHESLERHIGDIWRRLPMAMKVEHLMLRWLKRRQAWH